MSEERALPCGLQPTTPANQHRSVHRQKNKGKRKVHQDSHLFFGYGWWEKNWVLRQNKAVIIAAISQRWKCFVSKEWNRVEQGTSLSASYPGEPWLL